MKLGPFMQALFQSVRFVTVRLAVVQHAVIVAICWAMQIGPCYAEDPTNWLSGRELEKAKLSALSSGVLDSPLRDHLNRLSRSQKIPVFVDRRVDANHAATYSVENVTWEQLTFSIADQYEVGVCRLDDLYYFGPKETCRKLPVLYQRLQKDLLASRKRLKVNYRERSVPVWPRLSQPSQLLQELAAKNDFQVDNADAIHFDVWPAMDLPEMTLAQQLVLLVVGFDRWIKISKDGKVVKIVPTPKIDSGQRKFVLESLGRDMIRKLKNHTNCKMSAVGRSIVASGSVEDLEKLDRKIASLQSVKTGDQRFSLNDTTAPRSSILASIAQSMSLQLSVADDAKAAVDQQITITISEVTFDEIVNEVLKGSNLGFRTANGQLQIFTK